MKKLGSFIIHSMFIGIIFDLFAEFFIAPNSFATQHLMDGLDFKARMAVDFVVGAVFLAVWLLLEKRRRTSSFRRIEALMKAEDARSKNMR
jgi:hypothetical protein